LRRVFLAIAKRNHVFIGNKAPVNTTPSHKVLSATRKRRTFNFASKKQRGSY
tara:strand:- start:15218 stop:15373 length:156 start_codon:yes stop_codon:yes gene_type:complete